MFTNRRGVLHVDDDPLITKIVAEQLKQFGYESEAINDPLLAMEALKKGQYRIVLLDIHMPGRTGLQLLAEIKTLDAGIQVIMLTGLVNETTVLEAITQGAEACLFKPLNDSQLLVDTVNDAFKRNDRWWHTLRDLTQRRKALEALAQAAQAEPAQV